MRRTEAPAGNAQQLGNVGLGGGGVDFFVGVGEFDAVIVLQGGEQRTPSQGRLDEVGKLCGGEIAGLQCERIFSGEAEALDLDQSTGRGQAEARGDFRLLLDTLATSTRERGARPRLDMCSV